MSMETSASVWSMTMLPPEGRSTVVGERRLDLALDLKAGEERNLVGVVAQLAQVLRHGPLDELAGLFIGLFIVDEDFADIVGEVVAQRTDDRVAVLEDQERGRAADDRLLDGLPDAQQVVHVPLEFFGGAAHAGSTDDDAHAPRGHSISLSVSRISSRSSPLMRRETPPAPGLFGIRTMKRPARLMKVVSAAPLVPRSSFSTWTTISCPSRSTSRMLTRAPAAGSATKYSLEISFSGRKPWRSRRTRRTRRQGWARPA